MLEFLQWVFLMGMGVGLGWLWRDRNLHHPPEWLTGLDEEDLVRQSDLDQYHHRVVQLSHTQRDLLTRRIETLEEKLKEMEVRPPVPAPLAPFLAPGRLSDPGPITPNQRVAEPLPMGAPAVPSQPMEAPPPIPPIQQTEAVPPFRTEDNQPPVDAAPVDPTAQVLQKWRAGRPVEEIARELRMGRQEVQLLIEMSRHTVAALRR